MDDKIKIFVWPDNSWVNEDDIDDMDWYLASTDKGDDYAKYYVSIELDADDIDELIELKALPGMLPDPKKSIEEMGKVPIPEGAILIVHHSKDIDYSATTILKDKIIINAPDIFVEVIQSKK